MSSKKSISSAHHGASAKLAVADTATKAAIAKGYVASRQLNGKVVGVWGEALLRTADGEVRPLKTGDMVKKGDVVLTAQDGIIQIEGGRSQDLDRIIASVSEGKPETAPAAGPLGNDPFEPGLRVDRVAENVTPASMVLTPLAQSFVQPTNEQKQQPLFNAPPVAGTVPGPNGPVTDPNIDPSTGHYANLTTMGKATAGRVMATDPNNDTLSFAPSAAPAHGTVVINPDGTWSYTPDPTYKGTDSFSVLVSDGHGGTAISIIDINVVDTPSTLSPDTKTVPEDTAATGNVLANDSDPDDALSVASYGVNGVQAAPGVTTVIANVGSITLLTDGSYSFVPAPNWNGTVPQISYTTNTGITSTLDITITPVSDSPAVSDDAATTPEDTPITLDVLDNDSDPDAGTTLTITEINGQPVSIGTPVPLLGANGQPQGQISLTPEGKLVFMPAPHFNGPVAFSYTVTDGQGSVQAQVKLEVTPVNDPPVASADTATVPANTPVTLDLLGNDSDPDQEPLHITAVNGQPVTPGTPVVIADPAGTPIGQLTMNANGTVTFQSVPGYHGPAAFTYTLADPSGAISTATVTLDVGGINHAPEAAPDTNSTPEDATLTIPAATGVIRGMGADTDVDGDSLSVSSVGFGATAGTVGQPLPAAWGTLTLKADGSYTYTPNVAAQALDDGESQADVFTYTVTDPAGQAATTTLAITVTGANDAPVVVDDADTTLFNTPVTIPVLANDNDVDGEPLTITAISGQPISLGTPVTLKDPVGNTIGQVSLNADGTLTFTPAPEFSGPVDFSYTVSDRAAPVTGNVHVVVGPNHPPVANSEVQTAFEDTPVTFDPRLDDTDADGDKLTITQINGQAIAAAHPVNLPEGVLSMNPNGSLTFTPNANFNGPVSFSYTVNDGHGGTSVATVTLNVAPANDAPKFDDPTNSTFDPATGNYAVTTPEDTPVSGQVKGSDVDGDPLTYAKAADPTHGTVVVNPDGTWTYTPGPSYNRSDVFTVTVSDGHGGTATSTSSVGITPVNDAPVAVNDSVATNEDTPITIAVRGNDSDVDGDTLTVSAVTNGAHGTVVIDPISGNPVYTPAANFNGTDTFTYTVSDGHGGTATATVTVTVALVDDPSVLAPDAKTVAEDNPATGNVLGNDVDVDNVLSVSTFTVAGITAAAGATTTIPGVGSITIAANGDYTFTPLANWNGSVPSVSYTTNTGSSSTLAITVTPVDDPSVLVADAKTVAEDTPATGNVLGNDVDVDNVLSVSTFTVAGITAAAGATTTIPGVGSITIAANGDYSFTPLSNWNGSVPSVSYTTNTGSSSTLAITVTPANDAPTLGAIAPVNVSEEGLVGGIADTTGTVDTTNSASFSGSLPVTDADNTSFSISITQPATALTSNGVAVTWTGGAAGADLVGMAGTTEVLRVHTTPAGGYTVTLSAPIDHTTAGTEDVKTLNFGVAVSDGTAPVATSTLTVNIEDDAPTAANITQTVEAPPTNSNILLVIDVSGSMSTTDGPGGITRLQTAKNAIAQLLTQYENMGEVRVQIVSFSSSANVNTSEWVTVSQANTLVNALTANGGTNYDAGIASAMEAYNQAGKLAGAQSISYFLSDGAPTFGVGDVTTLYGARDGSGSATGTDGGLDPAEQAVWQNFLLANDVTSHAIGLGSGVTSTTYLDPIAYNGATATDMNAQLVTNLANLNSALTATVPPALTGQLLNGGLIGSSQGIGADHGYVRALTVDGSTYTYNPAAGGSVAVTGANNGVFDTAGNVLTISTANGGKFAVDLDDGNYTYTPPAVISGTKTEAMTYLLLDNDADSASATITFNVSRASEPVVTMASATYVGDAYNDNVTGTASADSISAAAGNDLINGAAGNDTLIGGAGNDTLIGGAGSDVFKWSLNDGGSAGAPARDVIKDFSQGVITLANPGAESVVVADGGSSNTTTGWTASAGTTVATANPNTNDFLLDGDNAFRVTGDGDTLADNYLSQTVPGSTFSTGGIWTVTADVGWAQTQTTSPTYKVELWAGSTLIGSVDQTASPLIQGQFVEAEFTVNGAAFPAVAAGTPLSVRLVGMNGQAYFDNIQVTQNDGDSLDLRDLLQGELHTGNNAGNLANYLHFEHTASGTELHISSTGGFAGGYSAAAEDQVISIEGINLVGAYTTDAAVIQDLLNKGKLIAD